ncbi:phytoene desaturase family protein [Anoxybacillus kestanbolensis]|uniref:phytoene desaturase family protein n=1 Tax=Anoxybacillus kestanbolensis TaxID=227476 RepID=UPI003D1DA57D
MTILYDVIIIGTGFGGITASALLAKKGYRTLTFEAANEFGGCAGKFERQSFRFQAGATLGMGFEENGVFSKLFHELDISPLPVHLLDTIMDVHFPDRTIRYYQQKERWFEEIAQQFPKDSAAIVHFFEEMFSLADALLSFVYERPMIPPKTTKHIFEALQKADRKLLRATPFLFQSIAKRLEHYGIRDETFIAFLNGQLVDSVQTTVERCPALLGAVALSIFHRGAFYVGGGLATVVDALAERYKQLGGELRMREKVISIRKERHWLVTTNRKQTYEAKHVVFNGSVHSIFAILDDSIKCTFSIREEKEKKRPAWGAFTIYMGVDDSFQTDSLYHQFIVDRTKPMSEGNQFLLSASAPFDQQMAPVGKRSITISTHTEPLHWWNRHAYDEQKKMLTEQILQRVSKTFPLTNVHIQLIGTPVTFARFTHRAFGKVGGYIPNGVFSLLSTYAPQTNVEGLWLCGDTVFPGAGSLGCALSGWIVADAITADK